MSGHEIRKIWRWPKMATARVFAVAMATAKLAQQKWALLKWSLIQRSLHQFLNYWKAFWMGFIEFTKMAITSLKIGHFHPDFAQLRWPFLATVGLSGGGHCGGQLAWPPRISRPGRCTKFTRELIVCQTKLLSSKDFYNNYYHMFLLYN